MLALGAERPLPARLAGRTGRGSSSSYSSSDRVHAVCKGQARAGGTFPQGAKRIAVLPSALPPADHVGPHR